MNIEYHKYANLFPFIEGPSFDQFVEDVRKHGILEPVVFLDGKILDGRNRHKAAEQLGIDYPKTNYEGSDPLGFVLSHNLNRRHLTESQRAMVAASLAKLQRGSNQHSPIGETSQATAAKLLNVGKRSVERAKDVQQHGSAELVAAVEAGRVSVSAAAEVAGMPKDQQATVVAAGPKAMKEAAKESRQLRGKKPDPDIDAEWLDQIAELTESVTALEAEVTTLKAENKLYSEMKAEYEKGGFAEVVAGRDETIRVQARRLETENKELGKWVVNAKLWRKRAVELGYSKDEVIDLDAVNG